MFHSSYYLHVTNNRSIGFYLHSEVTEASRSDTTGVLKLSTKVITIFQKIGGHIHTPTTLYFKLSRDVIARKDALKKICDT